MKLRFKILVILLFCTLLTLEQHLGSLSKPPTSQGGKPGILVVRKSALESSTTDSPDRGFYTEVTEERSDEWKNEVVNASPNGGKVTRATIRVALLLVRGKIPTLEGLSCWLARSVPTERARGSQRLGSPSVLGGGAGAGSEQGAVARGVVFISCNKELSLGLRMACAVTPP